MIPAKICHEKTQESFVRMCHQLSLWISSDDGFQSPQSQEPMDEDVFSRALKRRLSEGPSPPGKSRFGAETPEERPPTDSSAEL